MHTLGAACGFEGDVGMVCVSLRSILDSKVGQEAIEKAPPNPWRDIPKDKMFWAAGRGRVLAHRPPPPASKGLVLHPCRA